jgi:hypothetical protein
MRQIHFIAFLIILVMTILSACTGGESSASATPEIEIIPSTTPALAYADVVATRNAAAAQQLSAAETISEPTQEIVPSTADINTVEASATSEEAESAETTTPAEIEEPLTPTPAPTIEFDPDVILGVPVDSVVYLPEETVQNAREIYSRGQSLGRDRNAFSKLGDSLIANPHFLTGFDSDTYDLGEYAYLQPAIDQFAGSYERYGVAIHAGLHSWGVFDPMWADKNWCQPNETIVACEFRLNNPSVLLILLGSNDSGTPGNFAYNVRKLVEFSIENGVIPVLTTKADRFEGPENTNNELIKEIAAEYSVPLWDFDLLADKIPDRGLKDDQIHLTPFDEFDYTLPEALSTGHGVHNLTALMVLDAIRTQVMQFQ